LSGEVIILTETFSLVTAVQESITEYLEKRRLEIEKAIREKKEKIEQWQHFQDRQRQNIEEVARAQAQLQEKIESFKFNDSEKLKNLGNDSRARGFIPTPADHQSQIDELTNIVENARSLPAAVLEIDSPIYRLVTQAEALINQYQTTQPPSEHSISSFKQALKATIDNQLQELQEQQLINSQLLEESEQLLEQVLEYQMLALSLTNDDNLEIDLEEIVKQPDSQQLVDLKTIEQHLLKVLDRQQINLSDIRLLSDKVTQIKQEIDSQIEQKMVRKGVNESVDRHLKIMGYRRLTSESELQQSSWLIPGGEQLKVRLHPDMRFAFQVQHERENNDQSVLSGDELNFLHQQEKKWCDDLPLLMEKLAEDGFQYQVEFRRDIPGDSIPIVVVDELDDLVAEQEDEKPTNTRSKTRYLQ